MTDYQEPDGRPGEQRQPPTTNHVIWGMTAGILIGTAIGFILWENPAVGVAIGIVIGFVLTLIFRQILKQRIPNEK